MASKATKGILALLVLGGVVAGSAVFAQTPDGETPANEGVCDDLMWRTPGLYGLCVAFCEAQDCEPDFSADNPFAECRPSSAKLLRNYDRKKQPGDPDMPCVRQAACPCWTTEELSPLRFADANDAALCVQDGFDPLFGMFDWDQWQIIAADGTTSVGAWDTAAFGPTCAISNSCFGSDPNCVSALRILSVSDEELAACKAEVRASGAERGFDCFLN